MSKNIAVYGIYPSRLSVEEAVDHLKHNNFRSSDISVLFPENEGTKDFAVEKHTKAPEGAASGAASGAIIGGALGWLVGAGTLMIPGLGPVPAAGPIVAVLTGVGAGGVVGGMVGALVGLGIPEYEAKRAREVLEHTGAEDVSSSGEAKADFATGDKPLPRRPVVVETPVETVRTTPLPPEDVDRPVIDETRRTRTAGDRIVEP